MVKIIQTGHLDRDIQDFLSGWGSCDLSTWDSPEEEEREPTEDDLRKLQRGSITRKGSSPEKKSPPVSQKKYTLQNRPKVLQPSSLRTDTEATRLKRLRFFRK